MEGFIAAMTGWYQPEIPFSVYLRQTAPEPGPAPTWTEVAGALGGMASVIEKKGWVRNSLASPWGLCMLGAFLSRNGPLTGDVSEQSTSLGLAVADMLVDVIRRYVCWIPAMLTQRWNSVILFNDSFCMSKDMALDIIRKAQAQAAANALRDGEAVADSAVTAEQEAEAEVPDYIPGQFTGLAAVELIQLLEQAVVKQPELAAAGT